VLEVALASDQITVAARNDAVGRATHYARQLGFRYASDIGVPAPTNDTSSPTTQRAR
jgi:hypothetical protein